MGLFSESLKDSIPQISLISNFFVYFTCYKTVETWNENNFDELIRVWNIDDNQQILTRVLTKKDSLPITDLTPLDFFNDSIPKSYFSHPSLSYLIPVHQISENESEQSNLPSNRDDGCPKSAQKRFTGTMTGNLRAYLPVFLGGADNIINLENIKVEIYDKDAWPDADDFLGSGFTNQDGNFSININNCANDGNNLEVYLKIVSINPSGSIKAVHRHGGVREVTWNQSNPISWAYNSGNPLNLNFGEIWPSITTSQAQLVHWANLARDFVQSVDGVGTHYTIGSSGRQLCICYRPEAEDGNFFIPKGVGYPSLDIWWNDRIFIQHVSRANEDMIWHEFGHYFMYHAQDKSWIGTRATWADHGNIRNAENPEIAWTEGWADGFGRIVDVFYQNRDGEGGNFQEARFRWEGVPQRVVRNGTVGTEFILTQGIASEDCIQTFLLDLYDGIGRRVTGIAADDGVPNPEFWGGIDNISIPFSIISKPLFNNTGGGSTSSNQVIQNISDYLYELTDILPCESKHLIGQCARLNRCDHAFFQDPQPFSIWVGTDAIHTPGNFNYDHFKFRSDKTNSFEFKSQVNMSYAQDVNLLSGTLMSFNFAVPRLRNGNVNSSRSLSDEISDPITVTNNAKLCVNSRLNGRWYNVNNGTGILPAINSNYILTICNLNTQILNDGIFQIGDPNGTTIANVNVCRNTTLTVGTTNFLTGPGKIVVFNNSKLTISEGAILAIFPNYEIVLDGENAILEIYGQLSIRNGATFTVKGGNNGFGKIIWHRNVNNWNNPPPLQIVGDPNGKFILEGNGLSHNLLTVDGNDGIYGPANVLNDFRIGNCKILLGSNTKINPEVSIVNGFVQFKSVLIDALIPNTKHNGIIFNGVQNNFENVTINNANTALRVFNWGNRNRLNVNGFGASNCTNGILSLNVPYYVSAANVLNSKNSAILGTGIDGDCIILGMNATNINGNGIVCSNDLIPSARLTSQWANYRNGRIGNYHFTGYFIPKCNEFSTNSDCAYSSYILGKLISNNLSYNYWQGNGKSIHIEESGWLNLHNGKNGFNEASSKTIEAYLAYPQANAFYPNGNISPLNDITMNIYDNAFWNTNWVANRLISPPTTVNYSVFSDYPGSRLYLDLLKNGYTSSNFNSDKMMNCDGLRILPPIKQGYKPGWFSSSMPFYKFLGDEYIGHHFPFIVGGNSVNIYAIFENLYNQLYFDSSNNYEILINQLAPILILDFPSNLSVENKKIIYYAYDLYLSALHEAVYSNTVLVDKNVNSPLPPIITNAVSVLNSIISKESGIWLNLKYRINKDIADLYTLSAKPIMALEKLDYILNNIGITLAESKELQHWNCLNTKLVDLYYNNVLSSVVFDSNWCNIPFPDIDTASYSKPISKSSNNLPNENTIKIYPNPASREISMVSQMPITKIEIYNISGKKLKEQVCSGLINKINISYLTQGIYYVRIMDFENKSTSIKFAKR